MRRLTSNSAALPLAVLLVASAVFFGWGFVASFSGCDHRTYEDAVDSWAGVGVMAALVYPIFGAYILATRLTGWLALVVSALMVLAIALGAQAGWAIGMAWAECEWAEGPALTLSLFATPGAVLGYASGWVLRQARMREEK